MNVQVKSEMDGIGIVNLNTCEGRIYDYSRLKDQIDIIDKYASIPIG